MIAGWVISGRERAGPQLEASALPLDDFDIVADADNFEMVRDVECNSWLANAAPTPSKAPGAP